MSSLISITQVHVGSNIESLQCGSLCGCVCDRMVDVGGKERRMFSIFVTKKFECICDVLIGVCRWKHWSLGFMKQFFNNVKEFFLIARALFDKMSSDLFLPG